MTVFSRFAAMPLKVSASLADLITGRDLGALGEVAPGNELCRFGELEDRPHNETRGQSARTTATISASSVIAIPERISFFPASFACDSFISIRK